MSDKLKTIPDIIAEMRGGPIPQHRHDRILLRQYADSIETAYKREMATTENSSAVGNAAKLREALREIYNCSEVLTGSILDDPNANARSSAKRYAAMICEIAASALAAPPRNCDVGTPEERIRRFEEYCQYRFIKSNCSECPLNDNNEDPSCFDLWLQMPYNEGDAK